MSIYPLFCASLPISIGRCADLYLLRLLSNKKLSINEASYFSLSTDDWAWYIDLFCSHIKCHPQNFFGVIEQFFCRRQAGQNYVCSYFLPYIKQYIFVFDRFSQTKISNAQKYSFGILDRPRNTKTSSQAINRCAVPMTKN